MRVQTSNKAKEKITKEKGESSSSLVQYTVYTLPTHGPYHYI